MMRTGEFQGGRRTTTQAPSRAFDQWLRADLKRQYNGLLGESLPESIVAVIREGGNRVSDDRASKLA
jgi:hypothetical protein